MITRIPANRFPMFKITLIEAVLLEECLKRLRKKLRTGVGQVLLCANIGDIGEQDDCVFTWVERDRLRRKIVNSLSSRNVNTLTSYLGFDVLSSTIEQRAQFRIRWINLLLKHNGYRG